MRRRAHGPRRPRGAASGRPAAIGARGQVHFERKQFKLLDLGSTNGTFATNGLGSTFRLKKRKNHILKVPTRRPPPRAPAARPRSRRAAHRWTT